MKDVYAGTANSRKYLDTYRKKLLWIRILYVRYKTF